MLASLGTLGCVRPNYYLAPQYRAGSSSLPQPAKVLPLQVCTSKSHEGPINVSQRKLANRVWPTAVWKGLHLPGDVRVESRSNDDWLCEMTSGNRDPMDARSFALNAVQRDEVAKLFATHPGAKSLLIPYFKTIMSWDALTETVRDAQGRTVAVVDTGKTRRFDTGAVVFGAFIVTLDSLAFFAKGVCSPGSVDQYCHFVEMDANYTNADGAVTAAFDWFPFRFLGLKLSPKFEPLGEVDASLLAEVAASSGVPDESAPESAPAGKASPEGHAASDVPARRAMKPGDAVEVSTGSTRRRAVVILVRADGKVHVRYPGSKGNEWVESGRVRRVP